MLNVFLDLIGAVLLLLQLALRVEVRFGLRVGDLHGIGGRSGGHSVLALVLSELADTVVHFFVEVIGHVLQIRDGNRDLRAHGAIALLTAAHHHVYFLIRVRRVAHPREHVALSLIHIFLWDKVRRGLSAGRVQTVALRLIAEREQEIKAFIPKEYWTIHARLQAAELPIFQAKLAKYKNEEIEISDGAHAARILEELKKAQWQVSEVVQKEKRRHASPPLDVYKRQYK